MRDLETLKSELKNNIPVEGMTAVMKSLKELLPEKSPKYNILLQLEADHKEIKLKGIEGILSENDLALANNKIRRRLIDLIDSLEADDFSKTTKRSRLREDKQIKKGHVLYRIPNQMQVEEEVKCTVRIALDKIALIEDIDVDEHTRVRSEVRVSDYMRVQIVDPSATQVFNIRTTSEPIQFIDEDEATEWKFYVTPLVPGEHILELKVVIMEVINGVERVREKSLEESVVIVTEPLEAAEEPPLRSAGMSFAMMDAGYHIEAGASGLRLPKALRTMALMLLALLAVTGATWAVAPHEIEWLSTRYLQNTKEAYEQYIEKYPESRHREKATYRKAKVENSPEAYEEYLEAYPEGDFAEEVTWELADMTESPEMLQLYIEKYPEGERVPEATTELRQLETQAFQQIQRTTSRDSLEQFIRTFPRGRYAPEIKNLLEITPAEDTLTPAAFQRLQDLPLPTTLPPPALDLDAADSAAVADDKADVTTLEEAPDFVEETIETPPPKPEVTTTETFASDADYFAAIAANMVRVEGDTYTMGCKAGRDTDCDDDEKPAHEVTVPDFYISRHEVTVGEYMYFVNATNSHHPEWLEEGSEYHIETGTDDYYKKMGDALTNKTHPVVGVSWDDATAYCQWLSERTGRNYRLPTEAEWEYAARGGRDSKGYTYAGGDDLDAVAWYYGNANGKTHPVAQKQANELGLYDMSGNVYEWVQDCWHDSYAGAPKDGSAWTSGDCDRRVLRGGSWSFINLICRVAFRFWYFPDFRYLNFGFRLAQDR